MNSSPKHTWSYPDRVGLCLLVLLFENPIRDVTALFNYIQKEALLADGFDCGMSATSIRSQINTMKMDGGTGNKVWKTLSKLSAQKLETKFVEQTRLIDKAAKAIAVKLIPITRTRALPAMVRLGMTSTNTRRRERILESELESDSESWISHSEIDDWSDSYVSEIPDTPTRAPKTPTQNTKTTAPTQEVRSKYFALQSQNVLLSSRVPTGIEGGVWRRPRFLYRAFEVTHGLRARRFIKTAVTRPPEFRSGIFKQEVRPHLERDESYMSPFLSFAQNPKVAMEHAFTNTLAHKKMALAVFRYDDLSDDALDRFGPNHTGVNASPYLVPAICKEHRFRDLPGGYTGIGEFLVWGSIHTEPVVIIDGADTLMIRAVMRTTRTINAEAGKRLAKHLPASMTEQDLELFLYSLINGFKLSSRNTARKTLEYFEFVDAATSGRVQAESNIGIPLSTTVADMNDVDEDCAIIEELSCPPALRNYHYINEWASDSSSEWNI